MCDLCLVRDDGEVGAAFVHVGRQTGDGKTLCFRDHAGDFFRVARACRHERSHIFRRMVRFHVRGLIGHLSIGGRMRFVEAVCGEGLDELP